MSGSFSMPNFCGESMTAFKKYKIQSQVYLISSAAYSTLDVLMQAHAAY